MRNRPPERAMLDRIPTPVGEALVVTDAAGALLAFDFEDYEPRMMRLLARYHGAVAFEPGRSPARPAVEAYFAGDLSALDRLPRRRAGTAFQQRVWAGLLTIRPGETLSYRGLAERIGAPTAVRAVGLANGANPIGVVVPCHRVIGADGSLTGYGGGLPRKAWLLKHEGARFKPALAA
ncbi:methylated-DNA--[protein]-cysteine S-methyltransferase [Phenylobacterium sp.]|uniref:methylated-DNA--[protein]-cysteine S-methyltransferase n=1 Tax=Phenylobacterium sp. TaxID=1871053 RepID=UPI002E2F86CB|nr:methylated-DNA--[protein]-cysteine S-methyltransferase [Phenylobacterium sp.]HEX2558756.1 methylated-DNA--[protein]-cysteine S-methyltransferase [Phenylobacterium sp.]